MIRFLTVVSALALLAGCSDNVVTAPVPLATPPDTSVSVTDAETLANVTLDRYVDVTNAIAAGEVDARAIGEVTSDRWAAEEVAGYLALGAIGPTEPPSIDVSRVELGRVRGTVTVVDVTLHVCFSGAGVVTLTSVVLVPSNGVLVIDNIQPWEDSTWCAPADDY